MCTKFRAIFEEINNISSSVGNEALYTACAKSNLNDKNDLCGMMWLIGRSYAASPQRRSYGLSKRLIEKEIINKNGEKIKKARPVWLVKTENSGNGDFFLKLAEYIMNWQPQNNTNSTEEKVVYDALIARINEIKNQTYKFNKESFYEDVELLVKSIEAVSRFNRLVKRGTEKFDMVPDDHRHKISNEKELQRLRVDIKSDDIIDYVYCKNQISFASKFLHFFCRNSVFIIDQFSKQGGEFFFDNQSENTYHISNGLVDIESDDNNEGCESNIKIEKFAPNDRKNILEDKGYLQERDELFNLLLKKLENECSYDKEEIVNLRVTRNLLSKKRNTKIKEKDWFMYDYMLHCANSYTLCLYIKNVLQINNPKVSYPRFSDTVFMRIKEKDSIDQTTCSDNLFYN